LVVLVVEELEVTESGIDYFDYFIKIILHLVELINCCLIYYRLEKQAQRLLSSQYFLRKDFTLRFLKLAGRDFVEYEV
jgi:hypothetical protein